MPQKTTSKKSVKSSTKIESSREIIEKIVLDGSAEEKKELYGFSSADPEELVAKKFKIFARANYPRFFELPKAQFHDFFALDLVKSYRGENRLLTGFRGCAKTAYMKLFLAYVLLNDLGKTRRYLKVLSRDLKNSKQVVTDVHNLLIEMTPIYGNVFEDDTKMKREETMGSFTLKSGVKIVAGTVGQQQRGHIQDAYRPDWIVFEDVEDSKSISSSVVTGGIIRLCEEAIKGLAIGGSYYVNGNYISDTGVIEWFKTRSSVKTRVIPLLMDADDDTSVSWEVFTPEKVAELRRDSLDFAGEYLCDPAKSENKFFDLRRIYADLKRCRTPDRESAGVRYWGKYLPHHRYGAASDHSEGVRLDANTLAGFDFTTSELIFTYANNEIGPDLAAHEFSRVCAEFGNCLYAPEANNSCGGTAITTLRALHYPNLYQHIDETDAKERVSQKFGWPMNSKTRYNAFFEFRTDYNDGLVKIYDRDVLNEMKAYGNADLTETAKAGLVTKHFDLLTAVVIAWQMRKYSRANSSNSGNLNSYRKAYKQYVEA